MEDRAEGKRNYHRRRNYINRRGSWGRQGRRFGRKDKTGKGIHVGEEPKGGGEHGEDHKEEGSEGKTKEEEEYT